MNKELKSKINPTPLIDPTPLISKAKVLSNLLNDVSNSIQIMEEKLREINANFPFWLEAETEKESSMKQAEERHKNLSFHIDGYRTKKSWLLSWQKDEQSKDGKFRLFLVELEKEFIYVLYPEDEFPRPEEFKSTVVFKTPLRQTKIAERMRFSKHLQSFFDAFTKHLDEYCISIENLKRRFKI